MPGFAAYAAMRVRIDRRTDMRGTWESNVQPSGARTEEAGGRAARSILKRCASILKLTIFATALGVLLYLSDFI